MDVVASLITTGSKPSAGDASSKRGGPAVASPAAPAPAPVRSEPTVRPTQETLAVIARQIDSYLRSVDRSLQFSVDETSGRMVISVRDASGNLVRQIPGEEALRLAAWQAGSGATLLDMTV